MTSQKQRQVLDAIEKHIALHGTAPSYRELAQQLGYTSTGSVYRFVKALKEQGLLETSSRSWRNLSPNTTTHSASTTDVEIIALISRDKNPEFLSPTTVMSVPNNLINKDSQVYGLTIQDASFISEHLLPGDLILVEPTESVSDGEFVLASAEKTIIGHYFEESDYIRFRSSPYSTNSSISSTRIHKSEIQLWGVIVALIRNCTP